MVLAAAWDSPWNAVGNDLTLTYNVDMEPIIRNVRDIAADDRLALERIVGQPLRDNQRLTIQITDVDVVTKTPGTDIRPQQTLDDWTKVYEGLNDDEIEEVEALILDRSQWRRNSL